MRPGDQHNMPGADWNPFLENRPTPFTAEKIASLSRKLEQQLGPEYLSTRPGPGGQKVEYLASDKVINLANEVLGFNGWSSSVRDINIDFIDEHQGKWSTGVSVVVRITLQDGTYHEDIGYGSMENGRSRSQVFEKAKKEAVTDGIKRALRQFGNILGLCLSDKEYLAKVKRMKKPQIPFDESRLHRQITGIQPNPPSLPVSAPKAPEAPVDNTPLHTEYDEYGGDEFDEFGVFSEGDVFDNLDPDTVIDSKSSNEHQAFETPTKNGPNGASGPLQYIRSSSGQVPINNHGINSATANQGQAPPPRQQTAQQVGSRGAINAASGHGPNWVGGNKYGPSFMGAIARPHPQPPAPRPSPTNVNPVPKQPSKPPENKPSILSAVNEPPEQALTAGPGGHAAPVGFFSGRAVKDLPEGDTTIAQSMAFDPRRPTSLPRTAGIDHSTSSPVKRKVVNSATSRPNFANPSQQTYRQIGLPPGRSPYRPPSMAPPSNGSHGLKRGPEHVDQSNSRSALKAATGQHLNAPPDGGQPKRPKT